MKKDVRLEGQKAYHKLVKTTPKPRATKNKRGELVGPELFEWSPLFVGLGAGGLEVGADMAAQERIVRACWCRSKRACLLGACNERRTNGNC